MALNAGQQDSAASGFDKAKAAEGQESTKKVLPPVRTLPSGPLPPYESLDAISPPAIPEDFHDIGRSKPLSDLHSDRTPSDLSDYSDHNTTKYTDSVVKGAALFLEFYGLSYTPHADNTARMASPQLIFVDGTFAELAQEMADYIQANSAKTEHAVQVGDEVRPLLEKEKNEDALEAIVKASGVLNTVPEKEFTGAINLLIHLVLQSNEPKRHLPAVCSNLLKPITSSPSHGFTLAASALSTIFNLLDKTNPVRYNVFLQIIRFIRQHGQYELLKPRLKNLEAWFADWETNAEDQRKLYIDVADAAAEAGDDEESYHYILKALSTFEREEAEGEEAQKYSLKALKMAISSPTRFDFQDLRALPSVQALSDSQPVYSQLLDIFTEQDLEDYNDFREEHEGWIEKEKLDHEKLQRKMRLLTFASLAASTPNREIPYANIAKALQIPSEDVEMWTIDVVRAKLVEGRLSQKQKVFLVHRTTYRVFGEKQWRELGTRIDQFKLVVDRLTSTVRRAQAEVEQARKAEEEQLAKKLAGAGISSGNPGDRRRQPRQRTDDDD
ncbi:uncharacterized protein PODANS_1_7870 [Podospora anserina S mat+]|uniref:Eukaryotic translation initiation factor 3 subunit M n=1 Tax=Podospora anserina (strain S / ATCC MYA-4624 / DSM 980 / FGSC 10383) TaxID=515849 RepID=B2A8Z0_PODAN|nr:uncharacterized protein PODANS_1_7870 [Podospora anserina S mat+]CAP60491.1 unnamed protein product [Podospora anserina S mat+]CDP23136.1 Putative translation initiation factor 3 subunit M [Podospora anserina S mat+]